MDQLDKDRKRFAETKRLSLIKRIKCKHEYVYLGIDIHEKVFWMYQMWKNEMVVEITH
ncbi:TPA: hypothetical protein QFK04_001940 [Enterococcus faecium]